MTVAACCFSASARWYCSPHLLGQPGDFVVDPRHRRLRSDVSRPEPGSPGCHDQVIAVAGSAQEGVDDALPVVGKHLVGGDVEALALEDAGHRRSAGVLHLAGEATVGDRDDHRPAYVPVRRQSPLFPPVFESRRTFSRYTPFSTPLTMSIKARPATAAAVSASISTPVWPLTRAVATIRTRSSSSSKSTSTLEIGSG